MALTATENIAGLSSRRLDFEPVADWRAFEPAWRAFQAGAAGHVFAEYDFVASWLEHLAPERNVSPRILAVHDAGRLVAILPFCLHASLGARVLEWIGGMEAGFPGGLFDRAFLAGLANRGEGAAFAELTIQAAGGDIARLDRQLPDIDGHPNPFALRDVQRCHYEAHNTTLGDDWERYYSGKRQPSSRRIDRRKIRKLEGQGPIRFVVAGGPAEAAPILEALFAQKKRGLAEKGVGDLFATPGARAFHKALAAAPYPNGPSHISALYAGDEIVATSWSLVRGKRFYYALHAFAAGEVGRTSPGRQLMYRLMQWSIDQGIDTFDFIIGNDPYKDKWCETVVPLYSMTRALTPRGAGLAAALRGVTALKRLVKTTPPLRQAADFARRRLGRSALARSPRTDSDD